MGYAYLLQNFVAVIVYRKLQSGVDIKLRCRARY